MSTRASIRLAGLVCLGILIGLGGQNGAAQDPKGPKVLTLSVMAKPESARSGWDGRLEIAVAIEPGYHINSNSPVSEFLIPTSVKFRLDAGVDFGPLEYPRGRMTKFDFSEDKMSIYEGRVVIAAPYKAAAGAARVHIQGTFSYQACTDQSCLQPRSENFELLADIGRR